MKIRKTNSLHFFYIIHSCYSYAKDMSFSFFSFLLNLHYMLSVKKSNIEIKQSETEKRLRKKKTKQKMKRSIRKENKCVHIVMKDRVIAIVIILLKRNSMRSFSSSCSYSSFFFLEHYFLSILFIFSTIEIQTNFVCFICE